MDEPLASLDDERKAEILPYIERLRDEVRIPIVYVSHAVSEIARLATTVVVVSKGRVKEIGSVSEILSRPLVLGPGGREAGGILTVRVIAHDMQDDLTVLAARSGQIAVPRVGAEIGAELRVHIHARDVMLATEEPRGLSALNVLPARVVQIGNAAGPIVDVVLDFGGERLLSRITRRSLTRLAITPGHSVFAVLKSVAIERRDIGFAFGDGRDDSPSDA
jgi:molybdate transport system ATP-binding protein